MDVFKAALINEIEKINKKKKVVVSIILSLLIIIFSQLAVGVLNNQFGIRGTSKMEFPLFVLSIISASILPLFTALIAIDSFSGEFTGNTMKIAITRPISRLKFFIAKITAIIIFVAANLLLLMVLSTLAGIIFNNGTITISGLVRVIIAYTVTVLPMAILVLVIVTLANILKNGIAVFFLSILIFIVFKVFGILYYDLSPLLFTSMFSWYNLWILNSLPLIKIFRTFMLMAGYGIILFSTSYYIFDNKDF